jgi:hypothetical protein
LNNLNEDDKTKLNEYKINNNFFHLNTLFDYSSFIKCLNTRKVFLYVSKWVRTTNVIQDDNSNNFGRLIYELLFKRFIENKVNLHTFEVAILSDRDYSHFNYVFNKLISQNPNFIRNIKNLSIQFNEKTTDIKPFLKFVYYNNYHSISSLYFRFPKFHNHYGNLYN